MAQSQFFDIHGIKIDTTSVDPKLNEFIRSNFFHFTRPDDGLKPNIIVDFQGYKSGRNAPTFGPTKSRMTKRLSSELFWDDAVLYWLSPRIRAEVAFDDGVLTISGNYQERIDHTIRRILLRNRSILFQNYQTWMRYLIHYPLFWYLRKTKGIEILHASAVEKEGKALIFTGLNGCGKSTLATYFWQHRDYKLLSDNFLLFDNRQLYGFPEVTRAEKNSIAPQKVVRSSAFPIFNKYQFVLSPEVISRIASPRAIFFTYIGQKTRITPISFQRMMQWLTHIFHFLGEFPQNTYMEFFEPSNLPYDMQDRKSSQQYSQKLAAFVQEIACYELEIGYGESVQQTVQKLLEFTQ